jgi:copper chaperone
MTTTTYGVTGLTCEHCVRAVISELSDLGEVSGVTVELVADGESQVSVISSEPLAQAAVTAGLDEAGGYLLVGG